MDSPVLLIGAARTDITPSTPQMMGGYGVFFLSTKRCRWSTGVHDPLFATAMVFQKDSDVVAFLSLDLIGLASPDVNDIRNALAARVPIDTKSIVVSSNHTHHGPDTMGLWGTVFPPHSGRDETYMAFLKERASQAVIEAFNRRKPARLTVAVGELAELHRNIRLDQDPAASIDHTMTVLRTEDLEGVSIATLTNWACHPTAEYMDNRLISADWIGAFYQAMNRRNAGISMYVNGSIGATVQPFAPGHILFSEGENFRWVEEMGPKVADAAWRLLESAVPVETDSIRVVTREVTVPMRSRAYDWARRLGLLPFDLPKLGKPFTAEVSAIHIGPIAFGTVPGEISPNLGLQVRKALGGKAQIIINNAQDSLGYIIDPAQYADPRYRYEKMICIGPELGPAIVKAHQIMAATD